MKIWLLLALLMVAQHSTAQEQVAIMYVQKHITEALLELCSEDYPDEAAAFEQVFARWEKANGRVIKKGKKEPTRRSSGLPGQKTRLRN